MRGPSSSPSAAGTVQEPAFAPHAGAARGAGAARLRALADAARGAAGASSPAELGAVLRRACAAGALSCDGFRFAPFDAPAEAPPGDGAPPAVLSVPVRAGDDTLGVLVLTRAAGFGEEEEALAEALAAVAAPALQRIRMAEALRASEGWEQRVDERTRELAHANDALEAEVQQHRAAREELLHRTRELEVIFSALPDLYFRLAEDGTILSYRAGSHNGLYVDPDLFLDRRLQDVMPPEVGERFDAARAEVARTGQVASMEYTLPFPGEDGEPGERAYEARLVPLMPGELAAVVRDITERREAEAALRASEESYRGLFDNLSELVYIQDLEGRFLNVNEAVVRAYGYTREELLGQTPEMLAAPGVDLRETVERFGRAVGGAPQRCEWWGRRRDGSVFPKDLSLARSTYFGRDAVIAVARDITERVEAERALRAREEHFRRLIENASDMVSIIAPDGTIRYESEAIERMFGYTVAEGVGVSAWTRVHPDDHDAVRAALADVIRNPRRTGSAEFRYRNADGEWRFVEAVGKTLTDDPEEGIVINTRDVTARRLAEEALRRAVDETEAANRAKSEFLSRMSHELRTPMNSILGFAQLLERAHLPVEHQRGVQHILTAGRHLLRLINEVLDIARIESGRQQLSLEPVRLNAVLQEALVLSRPLAAQAAVSLVAMEGPSDAVFVRADRQRLVQVLLNLLSNAVKYNHRGGAVHLSWEAVEVEGGDPRVRLRVTDTGRGIAPEKQGELFVPFARLGAEYTGVEGTGLGLALSRRLVEAMGGVLRLERSGSDGSSFTVDVRPAADPLDGLALRAAPAGTEADAGAAPPVPVTLLYVEDNLANLSLVESILASRPGWRTIPALQGRLGADLACEHRPDLVLLDLHLPDMGGDEVLRRLRADPRTSRIPVVVISADATPRTLDRLRAEGADAYLTKPIDVDEFLSTVDRLLPAR